jgi:hypothetical protein
MKFHGGLKSALRAATLGVTALGAAFVAAAPATAREVIVTIDSIRALDKVDPTGKADFYARVIIDGQVFTTKHIRRSNVVKPNWVIRKRMRGQVADVKLQILDKDVLSKDDLIDINRIDGKRDLDFRVRGRPCEIVGFAQIYRCGRVITRAGGEKKSAEVVFRVNVR